MSDLSQPLAPEVCPRCNSEDTFSILPETIVCRHCGYTLLRNDALTKEVKPQGQQESPLDYGPRGPITPSFRITHSGELDKWARAAYNSGQNFVHQKKWKEAVESFQRALQSQKDFIDAHLWIAFLINDPVQKRKHLGEVIAQNPNHIEAIRELMVLDGKLSPDADVLDPHLMPETRHAGGAVGTETTRIHCPQCGSPETTTDEATGLVVCESCGFVQERKDTTPEHGSLTMALLQRRSQPVTWVVGERLLACEGCGADLTIPARKLSERCPFCGSKHVIERDVLGSFQQPDGLVPFKITRKEAGEAIKVSLKGVSERIKGWFSPNRVAKATLVGIYLPFWIFDAAVDIRRTTYVISQGGDWGSGSAPPPGYQSTTNPDAMNNVPVCAVKSPSPHLVRRLGKFDFGAVLGYEPSLLAKHSAELYSMDFDEASLEARARIGQYMRDKHRQGAYGTNVAIFTEFKQVTFQLLLLPVWVATLYEEDGDIRPALVNGQSGQVVLGKTSKPQY